MTSLREELREFFKALPLPEYITPDNIEFYINLNFFLFEKRIDSMIESKRMQSHVMVSVLYEVKEMLK